MNKARSIKLGKNIEPLLYASLWGVYDGAVIDLSDALGREDALFRTHLEVCGLCEGRGTTTAHVEHDGGGFTSSEWAEACAEDHDFAEDYISGNYDRPCPECKGKNVVPVVDEDNDPELLVALRTASEESMQAERDIYWESHYERMIGA